MAVDFVGVGTSNIDWGDILDSIALGTTFAIFTWLKSAGGNNDPLIAKWGADEEYLGVYYSVGGSTNKLSIFVRDSNVNRNVTKVATTTDDIWHSLICKADAGTLKIAQDNEADASGDTYTVIDDTGQTLRFGAYSNQTGDYNGSLAEVTFWSTIPTDNEKAAMSRGVNPFVINHDNLEFYSPLYDNTFLNSLHDTSHVGTVNGTVNNVPHPPVQLLSRYMSGH